MKKTNMKNLILYKFSKYIGVLRLFLATVHDLHRSVSWAVNFSCSQIVLL